MKAVLKRSTSMKTRLSRRTFIASAALSIVPTAVASAQPRAGALLSLFAANGEAENMEAATSKDVGVIDLSHSPFAKLKSVPVGQW